ncbi:MAG: hypothetical protein K9J06_11585 [Flavobacteriales bacterium]|nr:hypothetical protein [Flavobacteriales bacterium]
MKTIITLLFIPMLFASCSHSHPGSESGNEQVVLINGQRWKVNEEMKPHVEQGMVVLNDFLSKEGGSHKQLAEDLKEQNNKLIRSCTMDGQSHDELHKWLHPHIELVKELSEAESEQEVTDVTDRLQASYDLYGRYFE